MPHFLTTVVDSARAPSVHNIVLLVEDSRSCVGKRACSNMLWFCSLQFTTLKGITPVSYIRSEIEERNTGEIFRLAGSKESRYNRHDGLEGTQMLA